MNTNQLHRLARVFCLALVATLLVSACNLLPSKPLDPASVVSISGDNMRAFMITDSGELWATGLNDYGQLGLGLEDKRLVKAGKVDPRYEHNFGYLAAPIKISTNVKQAAIATNAGAYLTTNGELWVMGHENGIKYFPEVQRKLRNHTKYSYRVDVVRPVKVMDGVKKAVADRHILMLKENGDLFGIGENYWAELGGQQMIDTPLLIDQGVTDVFIGNGITFYVKDDGQLYSCGRNVWGELGFGVPIKIEYSLVELSQAERMNFPPQPIATDVQSVYSSDFVTLILKTDGKLYMLGKNLENAYPDGSEYSTTPQLIAEDVRKMGISNLDSGKAIIVLNNDDKLIGWGSGLASLGVELSAGQWAEIMLDVKDFWTTPNLFVLSRDGRMRAAGPAAAPFQSGLIKESNIGQLAGWTWD